MATVKFTTVLVKQVTKAGDTTGKGISFDSRVDELNHDKALQGIAREQRDRKAVKSDDTTGKGISFDSRVDELNHDKALQGIAREQRDGKAVKSDDAGVPEYLWEDELLEGLEMFDWDATKLKNVRRVSTWLRTMMLRWWEKSVTTSYIQWAREKYELTDAETPVKWVAWKDLHYV
jgi:hypothetical protein